jgi:DNA modification methylase
MPRREGIGKMVDINKIYCENNLDTLARMPDGFVDLVVTSPPYDNLRTYNGYSWDFEALAKELFRAVKKGGVVVWVVGDATVNGSETGTSFKQALYFMEIGFSLNDTMIYQTGKPPMTHCRYEQEFEYMFVLSKGKPSTFNPIRARKNHIELKARNKKWRREKDGTHDMGLVSTGFDKVIGNVWYVESGVFDDPISYEHPAVFPEALACDHILSWSNEGDLVYDPFMGSGTTAKAAHQLKRNWIGSEISQEYVDLANKRLEPYLAQRDLFDLQPEDAAA